MPMPDDGAVRRTVTVPELIEAIAARYADRPVVRLDGVELTYRELERRSAERARGLLAAGVGKGTRIGILFGNGPSWAVWWAAINRIGAVCVPLSTFQQPAELARVVRHADLHALVSTRAFLQRDFVELVEAAFPSLAGATGPVLACREAPFLRWIAFEGDAARRWCRTDDELVAAGAEARWGDVAAEAAREVHPDDEAIVIYTSGQSADPKGVVHTQRSLLTKLHYLRDAFAFRDGVECEIKLPYFWVGGLMMGLLPVLAAGGVSICSERSTWGTGQVVGSAQTQENPFAHLPKQASLGMTETLAIWAWSDDWRVPGYPLCAPIDELQPGFELKLVDDEGRPVADGTPGQIVLRGPTVTTRLHKVARADAFDPDGFYRTGDQAVRDGGRVHFVGRLNDMIKTSGANVAPGEVERELNDLPEIEVAHVVALDDPARDQIVAAAVVRAPGADIGAAEIRERLATRLARYKVPRKIVFLASADDVPMTPSLKVRRRELAALIAALDEPAT